jgi:hypothetical protein
MKLFFLFSPAPRCHVQEHPDRVVLRASPILNSLV